MAAKPIRTFKMPMVQHVNFAGSSNGPSDYTMAVGSFYITASAGGEVHAGTMGIGNLTGAVSSDSTLFRMGRDSFYLRGTSGEVHVLLFGRGQGGANS